jgi:hypothetical protein
MLFRTAALVFASSLALGAPAAYAAPPQGPVAVETVKDRMPQASPDASGYAAREQQDQKAAEFQGGDTVVVAMSGGAIVVLLLLLLILA